MTLLKSAYSIFDFVTSLQPRKNVDLQYKIQEWEKNRENSCENFRFHIYICHCFPSIVVPIIFNWRNKKNYFFS